MLFRSEDDDGKDDGDGDDEDDDGDGDGEDDDGEDDGEDDDGDGLKWSYIKYDYKIQFQFFLVYHHKQGWYNNNNMIINAKKKRDPRNKLLNDLGKWGLEKGSVTVLIMVRFSKKVFDVVLFNNYNDIKILFCEFYKKNKF